MITGFSHVQLVARDVDATASWFAQVLGMTEFASGPLASGKGSYAALRHPAGFVIGLQSAREDQLESPPAATVDHLSFSVADRIALDEWQARLRGHGISVGEVFEEAASYNVRAISPDGLVVELTARR